MRSRHTKLSDREALTLQKNALSGLKVIGFVTAGAGPMLVKSLATQGATVILVESAKRHNVTRSGGPFKDDIPGLNRSYSFNFINSDKYSISIDLTHPGAKEIIRRMVGWADVLADNWRTGVMESWGLSYENAKAIKNDIIMIGMTHAGHTGPHRRAAGMGIMQSALSGLVTLTGWPDRSPVTTGGLGILPDFIAPRFGVTAILAALDYRRRTGQGQYIDLSEYETSLQFQIPAILDYTVNQRVQNRNGNKSPYAAPHGVYRCQGDDKWCAIAVFTDSEWTAFCRVIGSPTWTRETKFSTLAGRKENEDELNKLVEEWTVNRPTEEVMMMMQQGGVEAGVLRTIEDAIEHCPQENHRHYWWTLEHPDLGKSIYQGNSYLLSKTPYEIQQPAPRFGEHTEYICTRLLGMSDNEFTDLFQQGVFE
jgi:benzylsuccinate CoA-transferase BbsF subunit